MRFARRRKGNTIMTNSETTNKTAAVAEQGAHVAPAKGGAKKAPRTKKNAPKGATRAKKAKPAPRAESKGATILGLLRRPKGASLAELMKASGWQAHSVRGFISIAQKKHGVSIESTKTESGERLYRITK